MSKLADLFNEIQNAYMDEGQPTDEMIDVTVPSFRLRIFGNPETMWQVLWQEYPGVTGMKFAGCVIGENPYNIFMVGLRRINDKVNVFQHILGHEFTHLVKQVVADIYNNRDTQASVIFNPDDLGKL